MPNLEQELIVGTNPSNLKLQVSGSSVGPGRYLSFDLSFMEQDFNVSELRSMSRGGLALRFLTRKIVQRLGLNRFSEANKKLGVYILSHDGGYADSFLQCALSNPDMKLTSLLRLLPPKLSLALTGGLNASQIAIEVRAQGPLLCLQPSAVAVEILIQEIEMDFTDGLIHHCIVGFSTTYDDILEWPETLERPMAERAGIFFLDSIDADCLQQTRARLMDFVEGGDLLE